MISAQRNVSTWIWNARRGRPAVAFLQCQPRADVTSYELSEPTDRISALKHLVEHCPAEKKIDYTESNMQMNDLQQTIRLTRGRWHNNASSIFSVLGVLGSSYSCSGSGKRLWFVIHLSHINRCHILGKHTFPKYLNLIKSDSLPAVTTPVILKVYPSTFISDEGLGSLAPNLYEFCVIL